jgi:hypothetical protein
VSTYAILFFGTPHNGSNKAALASTSRKMLAALAPSKVIDTDGQLLDALEEDSEVLQNITDMFVPLMKHFRIYFFWEQEKTDFGPTKDYVCARMLLPVSYCLLSGSALTANLNRSLERVLRPPFWTTLNGLAFVMITEGCAGSRVDRRQATSSSWAL